MSAPNLDCLTIDPADLWQWSLAIGNGVRPVRAARELFPARPAGYLRATVLLRCYAVNKAVAMTERLAGRIRTAQTYETICDGIYARLPEYAKW